MRLTRRDAVVSLLAGIGAGALGFAAGGSKGGVSPEDHPEITDARISTLVTAAETVYPSEVSGVSEFVPAYLQGLSSARTGRIATTADELDDYARRQCGKPFGSLDTNAADSVLRSLGADRTGAAPDGPLPDRVRYYIINQLLYGLYTSPKGTELIGIQNPVGYAGGYGSYQRPPSTSERANEWKSSDGGRVNE